MGKKIERQKATIALMLRLYCKHRLGLKEMDEEHLRLLDYCSRRLDRCRWQDAKPACKDCLVHCYAPAEREKIREIMRWAGPRMILYAPIETLRHFFEGLRKCPQQEKCVQKD